MGLNVMSTTRYVEKKYVLPVASPGSTLDFAVPAVSEELDSGRISSRRTDLL